MAGEELLTGPSLGDDREAAVVEEGIGRVAQLPLRHAELGVGQEHGLGLVTSNSVEVPPAGSVGDEMQLAAGAPLRAENRLGTAACDRLRRPETATVVERRDPKGAGVPWHIGLFPAQPAQPPPVGTDPRRREKAGSLIQHSYSGIMGGGDGDELARTRRPRGLADREQQPACGYRVQIAVDVLACRNNGLRAAGGGARDRCAIRMAEEHAIRRYRVCAAAIAID